MRTAASNGDFGTSFVSFDLRSLTIFLFATLVLLTNALLLIIHISGEVTSSDKFEKYRLDIAAILVSCQLPG